MKIEFKKLIQISENINELKDKKEKEYPNFPKDTEIAFLGNFGDIVAAHIFALLISLITSGLIGILSIMLYKPLGFETIILIFCCLYACIVFPYTVYIWSKYSMKEMSAFLNLNNELLQLENKYKELIKDIDFDKMDYASFSREETKVLIDAYSCNDTNRNLSNRIVGISMTAIAISSATIIQ